jgi:predicted ATPase
VGNILWAITDHLDFQLESYGGPLGQLQNYLRDKAVLLVLDNFDHLIAGGGLLTEILGAAPAVKILVTSRERLGLYSEVSYAIGGMILPGDDPNEEATQSEAVELFIERAKALSPSPVWTPDDLRQIRRICRLVEGMPLGIELAATWIGTLLPKEIADEMERDIDILEVERQDVPQSQRSIRAAFTRSWNLLDETQKTAFRRLSVFRGGLTREAGEAVAGVGLRTLQALVNKSLLRHHASTGRYDNHELLRHYAEEQLEIAGESGSVYQAHAAYFAGFMDDRWPRLKDHRQKIALKEIRDDFENIRMAWRYWIEEGSVPQLRKYLHSFWVFYDIQGWYPAGIELFEQGVQVMRAISTEEAEACLGWMLAVQGLFSVPVGDYDQAPDGSPKSIWLATHGLYNATGAGPERGFTLAQNGIQILKRTSKYREMMIVPLISLFTIASRMPEDELASRQAALDCLALATEIDDRWAIAKAKQFLAVKAIEDGEYEKAGRLAHEARMAFEANGDHWSISVVCTEVLGLLAIATLQFDHAKTWIRRGLEAAEEIDFKYSIQTAYWQLGYVAALEENYGEAGSYWRKALAVSDRMLGGRSFLGFGHRMQSVEWVGRKLSAS